MKLLLENWRQFLNENEYLFTYTRSGRNMDVYQNYPDTYNLYLDWVLYDKKDSAAKAYVDHFREMAKKYEKATGESPYEKNHADFWRVKPQFMDFFNPRERLNRLHRQQSRFEKTNNLNYKKSARRHLEDIIASHGSEEAASVVARKTDKLVNAAYKSLMSHRKEFLNSGAITGEEENKRLVDHLPSAFIYRPFMNPPGYEGTEMAGKVDIRGAHYEQ
jgi:hypothetical protein